MLGGQAVRVTTLRGVSYTLSLQSDGVFRATDGRAGGLGMEVRANPNGRTLRMKNGTEYDFDIFDLAGNLIRVADSVSGDALYLYDNLNRLTAETTDRGIVSYQYDAIGRLTERRINGQDPTLYAYDRANRLTTITYRGKAAAYHYDAAGRLISRSLPNGITQALTYDNAGQLLSLAYTRTDATVIERITYSYDDNGNRITRGRIGMGGAPDTAFTATYDAQNRMLTYNGQPLSYDDNGNLVSRQTPQGTISYAWDAKDQLTGISGPNGTAAFRYDHRGRRIERTVNGQTTAYLYDGPQAIAELQGSSIGATYLTGLQIDEVLARLTNQGSRTLLTDALGSVMASTDDTQTAQTIYGYSAYGETIQAGENGNPLQYTGRENDNTGLYYYRARYYDPTLKRFISSDPIGLAGGMNTYRYARANPLGYIDPTGLDVYMCHQPAFGLTYSPVDHYWLKTDTIEAGMGGARGNVPGNESGDMPFDPVQVVNHAGRSTQKGSSCDLVKDVDENKVNDLLKLDRDLGRWTPTNQCQSFVRGVLDQASTIPPTPMPWLDVPLY